jgi:hypothetical protein
LRASSTSESGSAGRKKLSASRPKSASNEASGPLPASAEASRSVDAVKVQPSDASFRPNASLSSAVVPPVLATRSASSSMPALPFVQLRAPPRM